MNLTRQYPFRVELHAHTKPISPCSDIPPEQMAQIYASCGYHGIVICNHFISRLLDQYPDREQARRAYCEAVEEVRRYAAPLGLRVYFGCELRLDENLNDYLLFGITAEDIPTLEAHLTDPIAQFSAFFRSPDHLLVQAHPFRDKMTQVDPALLDGIEVFNMHPGHNSRVGAAAKHAAAHRLLVTAGSDFHHLGMQAMTAVRFPVLPRDEHELEALLRAHDYVIEMGSSLILPYAAQEEP